ncbi:hypothetical protein BX666DRAFT_769494 [Dichotomocladium elegans]|nr:hypothetical protein BX666DRAFT_769494 [Dichotomocladium elegans]
METLRKQLELKAVEVVDVLEALDMDDKVPELMRRRRGQDNFDQPSEPHLAKQTEEMKHMWDQELESIAMEHTIPEVPSSFVRDDTPPPPTEPVKGRRREGSLVSEAERAPVVDIFDAGELNDDWFGDDSSAQVTSLGHAKSPESDNEDSGGVGGGNPMVAGDEDVEPVEYYSTFSENVAPTKEVAIPVQLEEIESEDDNDVAVDGTYRQPSSPSQQTGYVPSAAFRSEFINNVWNITSTSASHLSLKGPVASDSDDDDDINFGRGGTPGSFTTGIGGYEEIAGDSENNPWTDSAAAADSTDGPSSSWVTPTDHQASVTRRKVMFTSFSSKNHRQPHWAM